MPLGAPEVSVIITAYNRKEYLGEAIDSALGQTADPSSFEIVVLTNFDHPRVKELTAQGRIISAFDDAPNTGQTMRHGLEVARGSVLLFLDDDDLFEPEKVDRVIRAFRANPRACYYHNDFRVFRGGPGTPVPPPAPTGMVDQALVVKDWGDPGATLQFLSSRNRETNNSSTAVRRELLEGVSSRLVQVSVLEDTFLLFSAMLRGEPMIFDPRPLTWVRRHGLNVSKQRTVISRREGVWKLIRGMVEDSKSPPEVAEYLRIREARTALAHSLLDVRRARPDLWAAIETIIQSYPRSGPSMSAQYLAIGAWEMLGMPTSDRLRLFVSR